MNTWAPEQWKEQQLHLDTIKGRTPNTTVTKAPPIWLVIQPPTTVCELRDQQKKNTLLSPRLQLCLVPIVPWHPLKDPVLFLVWMTLCLHAHLCTDSITRLSRAPKPSKCIPKLLPKHSRDFPDIYLGPLPSAGLLETLGVLQPFRGHSVTYMYVSLGVCYCMNYNVWWENSYE